MTKITKKQEALLNELLKDFDGDAEDLLGKHGLVMELKKRGVLGEIQFQSPVGWLSIDSATTGSNQFSQSGEQVKQQINNIPHAVRE